MLNLVVMYKMLKLEKKMKSIRHFICDNVHITFLAYTFK